jgi:hypothetical protein
MKSVLIIVAVLFLTVCLQAQDYREVIPMEHAEITVTGFEGPNKRIEVHVHNIEDLTAVRRKLEKVSISNWFYLENVQIYFLNMTVEGGMVKEKFEEVVRKFRAII